ncbi:hypothetical protein C5Y96_01165 [Blastopirellula marina]|uniref:Uncharacterized protein n=1 Tax=Blastopirellula marina TaxID=124 RepID=A0A2S8G8M5_9BACT|nr:MULTISPECIES: hypothetical protein [Pirellulaceae]PQO40812.1 hypothetical protein C5Y96_01165 [Blastopirellula marina]RCS56139.1 hypothetical protein DTL36_01165 [Bremerella cremea]
MCQFQIQQLNERRGLHVQIEAAGTRLTFQEVAQRWQADPHFCQQFNQTLADAPYVAFRWELPGLVEGSFTQPFECVVAESLELRQTAKSSAFDEHFTGEQQVVTFPNLRGDAILVVPEPLAENDAYPHLAAFVRHASSGQQCLLWQAVGTTWEKRISAKPVWLSTAGAGVPWLHVRLDDRPKYYSYGPYRDVRASR